MYIDIIDMLYQIHRYMIYIYIYIYRYRYTVTIHGASSALRSPPSVAVASHGLHDGVEVQRGRAVRVHEGVLKEKIGCSPGR